MAWSTQNVWWRNSSAPGTFSGLFPRVRAYADPKPLPQAGGVRHRYTRTPPPRHSPGWLGGTLRAGPGPLIDPHGAHAGPGPTPPIPPLGHPTRHPLLVIWLRRRRLAGHPKNVLKNAAPRFDPPAKTGVPYLLVGQLDTCVQLGGRLMLKSIPPPIRPPLTPPSASLMPHLPGYPECRVRRSGAPPLLRNVPRRAAEVPLPAAPRHVRQNRGAGAMYYVWEMGTGSVLDHEVLKLVNL